MEWYYYLLAAIDPQAAEEKANELNKL